MTRLRAFALILALGVALPALAGPEEEAEKEMGEGVALYKKKKYTEAIVAYQRALALVPDAAGPYRELGRCYWQLNRLDDAIDSFVEYLNLLPDAPERAEIEKSIAALKARLATKERALLSVESDPPGAMVYILDASGKARAVGFTPLSDHPVDPRAASVRLSRPGYEETSKELKLKAGLSAELSLSLKASAKPVEPPGSGDPAVGPAVGPVVGPTTPETGAKGGPRRGTAALVVGVVAGVGAGAVGGFFLFDRASTLPPADPGAAAERRTLFLEAAVADGLIAVAALSGGLGLIQLRKSKKAKAEDAPKGATRLVPIPGGAALSGSF
jgi:tetratricopeptide (TPR) repeat protein